ncbi:hypothetical protein RDI58_013236 [Solanum bulbocastanum]|uniref:ZF-HD dimerization-type domain-containing protein n=1 Tax=Solanum bulbocastanum TaxID=147425 RepID=A0AAN8TQB5_SOLBU
MANSSSSNPRGDMIIKYEICLKIHATNFGDYSVDGCREFVKKGDGTKEEYICANCGCCRSFHRIDLGQFSTSEGPVSIIIPDRIKSLVLHCWCYY